MIEESFTTQPIEVDSSPTINFEITPSTSPDNQEVTELETLFLRHDLEVAVTDMLFRLDVQKIDALSSEEKKSLQESKSALYRNAIELLTTPLETNNHEKLKKKLDVYQDIASTYFTEEVTTAHELGHHAHTWLLSVDEIGMIEDAALEDKNWVEQHNIINTHPLTEYLAVIEQSNLSIINSENEDKDTYSEEPEIIASAFEIFFSEPEVLKIVAPKTYKAMFEIAISRIEPDKQEKWKDIWEWNVINSYNPFVWNKTNQSVIEEYYHNMEQKRLDRIKRASLAA